MKRRKHKGFVKKKLNKKCYDKNLEKKIRHKFLKKNFRQKFLKNGKKVLKIEIQNFGTKYFAKNNKPPLCP